MNADPSRRTREPPQPAAAERESAQPPGPRGRETQGREAQGREKQCGETQASGMQGPCASRRWVRWTAALGALALIALLSIWVRAAGPKPLVKWITYDLAQPWFDGKPWAWFLDMVNMPHLKPQEEGTIQTFPVDSVPRSGREAHIPARAMRRGRLLRDLEPQNPTRTDAMRASIASGRERYAIYCAVCHGSKGEGNTTIVQRGMPAPPITSLVGILSEAHLYNKIRYGGALMPAYGYQTTIKERWDLVNYMKSAEFGQ